MSEIIKSPSLSDWTDESLLRNLPEEAKPFVLATRQLIAKMEKSKPSGKWRNAIRIRCLILLIFISGSGVNRGSAKASEKSKNAEEPRRLSSDSGVDPGEQGVQVVDDSSSPTQYDSEAASKYREGK